MIKNACKKGPSLKTLVQIWLAPYITIIKYNYMTLLTVRWKMYHQKKIKRGCYMVNFTKFMIHMHLCIKNKINMWALFWLDQNYRFFIAKLTVFWSHFSLPKNGQFYYKKICNFDPIKKGLTNWFCFWCLNAYGS